MVEMIAAYEAARPVVKNILRKHADDTDDVLQEAAIRALRRASTFRGESAYKTWFVRIAINSAVMHLRRLSCSFRSGGMNVDELLLESSELTPEQRASQAERAVAVHAAIERLAKCRKRAALRWLYGEQTRDVAEKAARHCAKVELREELRWLN